MSASFSRRLSSNSYMAQFPSVRARRRQRGITDQRRLRVSLSPCFLERRGLRQLGTPVRPNGPGEVSLGRVPLGAHFVRELPSKRVISRSKETSSPSPEIAQSKTSGTPVQTGPSQ